MQRVELEVKPRELKDAQGTAHNLRELRESGWIPAVIYGQGKPQSVVVESRAFYKAVQTSGKNAIFTINVDGKKAPGIVKEIQWQVLTHKPIHIDFQRIDVNQKLELSIPVHVVGESPGVKNAGGILEHIQREIKVKCLPDDIPAGINVDVSKLEIGHSIKVAEITPPKGVEFITAGDHIVVNVVAPKVEEVKPATPTEGAAAGAAEPEVITKGKKEEEGAEGAAAATPAAAPAAAPAAGKGEKEKKK